MEPKSLKQWEKIAGFAFGVTFVAVLLAITVLLPNPTATQYAVFKIILALAAAGITGVLTGFLEVKGKVKSLAVKAGGPFAIFVAVFFFTPAAPQAIKHDGFGRIVIGDIVIGYTIEQHQEILEKARTQLRKDLARAHAGETGLLKAEKRLLEKEFTEVEQRLANIESSYQERIQFLQNTITDLGSLRGVVDDSINRRRTSLIAG